MLSMYARHFFSFANCRTRSTKFISPIGHHMPKKIKKHRKELTKEMTTEAAMRQLFKAKGHECIKRHCWGLERLSQKKD